MVWKLLRKNISVGQIAGYVLANLIGLAIVLSAVKFYDDVQGAWDDEDSFISKDYLIISRQVSMLNTLMTGNATFDPDAIDDLERQDWVREVGKFSAANFNVTAALDLNGRGMSTYIFLESIPDRFIDIKPEGWEWNPDAPEQKPIPIIMSKDYLTLYNFGFAVTRGMPQLSEGIIGSVPVQLILSGNGHIDRYSARIVGFSSRLNTIAVPGKFLKWANARYASAPEPDPSRLIIEVNSPGDPEIEKYLSDKGYEAAGDKLNNGKASYFLTLVTSVVIAVGATISILAFFILMLSIYLLLQKNREKLHDLMLLGYSPGQVAACYYRLVAAVNSVVLLLAIIIMISASACWSAGLSQIDLAQTSPLKASVVGIVIMAVITAINFMAISRIVRKNFRNR